VLANKAYWQYRLTFHLARIKGAKFGLNGDDTAGTEVLQ